MTTRKRVLFVSTSRVGRSMAGPGVRYWKLTTELSERFDVTLLAPNAPEFGIEGTRVAVGHPFGASFAKFAAEFDVVIAQQLGALETRALVRAGTPIIFDLYVPFLPELLGRVARGAGDDASDETELARLNYAIALRAGASFLCASERQRDFWLGALGEHGRLTPAEYRRDPSFRRLIDVIPFGIDPAEPTAESGRLKGRVAGIDHDDKVLLWGGGIWNWLDPLTPIRAMERLVEQRDDVKLYFLGTRSPDAKDPELSMARAAVALSQDLRLNDRYVFFNLDWTPFHERVGFLTDADIGVSAHFDDLEARFAYRTRLLDYFWARLPTVATRGDVLADLVEQRKLGRTVGPCDVAGWVEAILGLLGNPDECRRAQAHLTDVCKSLAWPRIAESLAHIVEGAEPRSPDRELDRLVREFVLRAAWRSARHGTLLNEIRTRFQPILARRESATPGDGGT